MEKNGNSIVVNIPMKFKKRGGRREIIVPEGLPNYSTDTTEFQKPMVIALARAHRWMELLEIGKVKSMAELAKKFGVDASYLSRILRLTLLAPDIVEMIFAGREPSGLSLEKLTKTLPVDWVEQRNKFKFGKALSV